MNQRYVTKELTILAMVTAACVVGRFAFQFIPNFQPLTTIFLLFTFYNGVKRGIIVAALSLVITSLYFGIGIWTVEQILAYAIILLVFQFLKKIPVFQKSLILQVIFAVVAGFLYGFIMSIFDYFIYGMTNYWVYYLQGVSFDAVHAVGNGIFYVILYPVFRYLNQRNYFSIEK
ncbi:ECF transporter S component [Enterococcus italicus]|uniref:ECF transporter S component n=1 Tax=Enterococcus italicus TaxID=246144 RepID=UPI002074697A|nr:ECF transporter S component [Enterococcus italicus]